MGKGKNFLKGIRQTNFTINFAPATQMQMRFPGLITRVINDFRQTTRSAARRTMVSPINCLTESGLRKGAFLLHCCISLWGCYTGLQVFALVGNCARKMTFDNAFRYSLCCLPSISGMKLEGRKIGFRGVF